MNWVSSRSWAGYTMIAIVPYILQRTLHFILRQKIIAQVSFHTVNVRRWTVEARKDTHRPKSRRYVKKSCNQGETETFLSFNWS